MSERQPCQGQHISSLLQADAKNGRILHRWAYEDPAPQPGSQQAAQAGGGSTQAAGSSTQRQQVSSREFTKRRWATNTAGDASGRGGDSGGSGDSKTDELTAQRRRLRRLRQLRRRTHATGDSEDGDEDNAPPDAWVIRTPPLQVRRRICD